MRERRKYWGGEGWRRAKKILKGEGMDTFRT